MCNAKKKNELPKPHFLGAFPKLRKALSCLPTRPHRTTRTSTGRIFRKFGFRVFFSPEKYAEKIKVSLKLATSRTLHEDLCTFMIKSR